MDNMSGHRDRIRKKYLKNGINTFQEYEILELLLTYAIPRKDTKDLAKNLLKKFKNIESVLKADKDELLKIDGIGEATLTFFKLMADLPTIFYENSLRNNDIIKIQNKESLIKYLRSLIGYEKIEKFFVLYLNNSNELIYCLEKFSGTIDRSAIYPREIYKDVIKYNAKSLIIAHNHPSGSLRPSKSDLDITKEIAEGLKNFDAVLIEHIIITNNSYFSFLEEGLI